MKAAMCRSERRAPAWWIPAVGLLCVCAPLLVPPAGAEGDAVFDRLLLSGRAALEDGLYALAEEQFETYVAEVKGEDASAALLLLARTFYEQKKYEKMLELFRGRGGRAKDVADPMAVAFWSGLAEHHLDRQEKALELIERLGEGPPESEYAGRLLRLKAMCLLATGATNAALRAMQTYDTEHPGDAELTANLLDWGRALAGSGDVAGAREVLARLAGGDTNRSEVIEGKLWLGRLLVAGREYDEAVAVLAPQAKAPAADAGTRVQVLFSLGAAHVGMARTNQAVAVYEEALGVATSADTKRDAQRRLGLLLLDSGRLDEALPRLREFVAASPLDAESESMQLRLAGALLDAGRGTEAVTEYQHYLETYSTPEGLAVAYLGKGWALTAVGRHGEGAAALLKAYDLHTDERLRAEALLKVGDAYFENGQVKLAAETYRRVPVEFPGSAHVARAKFQAGECLARIGEPDGAEALFLEVVEAHPGDPLAEEALLRIAGIKRARGQWADAIEAYERVMTVYTNGTHYAEALHARGLVRYNLFRFGEALEDFERVVREYGSSGAAEEAFYMSGLCHYGMGQDSKALDVHTRFREQHPNSDLSGDALFWLGKNAYNRGDHANAETHFLQLVEQYPAHRLADEALLRAGMAASRRDEYVHAIEILSRLVEEYPQSPKVAHARFAQADALSELARFSEAILIHDEIINKHPESGLLELAWGRKGDCQFTLGTEDPSRYAESIESYRIVANSSTAGEDMVLQAHYKIGRCIEKQGRDMDAFKQYYIEVLLRYLEGREKGVWHTEASKVWFTRAAYNAAAIMEGREDWRAMVRVLERVADADVPASQEARVRAEALRTEHWWLF